MEKFVNSNKPIVRKLTLVSGGVSETKTAYIERDPNDVPEKGTLLNAENLNAMIDEIEDLKGKVKIMNNVISSQIGGATCEDIGAVKAEGETFASGTTLGYYNQDEEIKMFATRTRIGCRPLQPGDTNDFSKGSYWDFSETADDTKLFINGGWLNPDTNKYEPIAKIGDKETYFKVKTNKYDGSENASQIAMGTDSGQISLRTTDGDIVLQARRDTLDSSDYDTAEQRIELNSHNIILDHKNNARITLDDNGEIAMKAGGFSNSWDGNINFTLSERNGISCRIDPNKPNQQIELDARNGKLSISGRGNTLINTADTDDKFNCHTELNEASYGNNDYRINFYPDRIRIHYITNKETRSTVSVMDITKDRVDINVPVYVNGKKVLTQT